MNVSSGRQVDAMKVEEKQLTLNVVLSGMAGPEPSAAGLQAAPSAAPPASPAPPPTASRALPQEPSPSSSYTERRRIEQEASQFTGFAEGYSAFTREYGKTLRFGATAASLSDRPQFRQVKHHSLVPTLEQRDAAGGGSSLLPPLSTDAQRSVSAAPGPALPHIGSLQTPAEGTSIVSAMKRRRRRLEEEEEEDAIEYADTIPVRHGCGQRGPHLSGPWMARGGVVKW